MRKLKSSLLLASIIFLAFVLRVYAIDRIPLGLTWDEAECLFYSQDRPFNLLKYGL